MKKRGLRTEILQKNMSFGSNEPLNKTVVLNTTPTWFRERLTEKKNSNTFDLVASRFLVGCSLLSVTHCCVVN